MLLIRSLRRMAIAGTLGVLALERAAAQAADPTVLTGRVSTETGQPLSDASVELTSLGIGAVTRPDGSYSILIPAARRTGVPVSITARRLGYRSETKSLVLNPGTMGLDFNLRSNPLQLGEIVVTGAGTSSEFERLGVQRKTVDSAVVSRSNETNVVQALAGKLPNVRIDQQSGEVGSSSRVQIRGVRSMSGTGQPLFVVDGVPINNNARITSNAMTGGSNLSGTAAPNRASDLNPQDIENIEVLSGPAASAIYGSLAGNGVVLITTKRGRAGRTSYSVRSNLQWDDPVRQFPLQRTYGVGSGGVTPTCVTGGPANCSLSANFFSWGAKLSGQPTYDHSKELFSTGFTADNTLQIQGGNDRVTYLVSGSYTPQDGFITGPHDTYDKTTLRFNGSLQATDHLQLASTVQYVQTEGNFLGRGNDINGLLLGSLRTPPDFNNADYVTKDGLHRTWRFPNPAAGNVSANRGFDNPFYALNESANPSETGRAIAGLTTTWSPMTWLTLKHDLSADFNAEDRLTARGYQASGTPANGYVGSWEFREQLLNHNLTASANYSLGTHISGKVLGGQQLFESKFNQVVAEGNTLIAPHPYRLSNTSSPNPGTNNSTTTRVESYFGQVQADLYDQLHLTGALRSDGSSAFGTETNRALYRQGQMSWEFTKLRSIPTVEFAKVRLSYGESGQIPAPYQLQDLFPNTTFNDFNPGSTLSSTIAGFGGLVTNGIRGNPKLKPEQTSEVEAGLDFSVLRDRVDAGVTYYVQNATDVILSFPLAPSTGFVAKVDNAAKIRNIGIEATMNVRPYTGRDLSVELGFNYGFNRNKVLELGQGVTAIGLGNSFAGRTSDAVKGFPMGAFRGTDFARCGRGLTTIGSDNIAAACQGQAANALYIGASGLPVVDPTVRVIGDPEPNYTAGARGTVRYKGLTISSLIDARQGFDVQNMTRASLYTYGTHRDTENRGSSVTFGKDFFPGQSVVGPGAGRAVAIGEAWYTGPGGINGPASQFQEDGSFVRLREISLGYTFNRPWVSRLTRMRSLDVRVAGRNLALWSDYSGYDPEVNLGGASVINGGFDWFQYPIARSLVVSIGLNR
jgi:TonB-linked SusC/RagA family outer membrane protein